jgi:hypothetical protein
MPSEQRHLGRCDADACDGAIMHRIVAAGARRHPIPDAQPVFAVV